MGFAGSLRHVSVIRAWLVHRYAAVVLVAARTLAKDRFLFGVQERAFSQWKRKSCDAAQFGAENI